MTKLATVLLGLTLLGAGCGGSSSKDGAEPASDSTGARPSSGSSTGEAAAKPAGAPPSGGTSSGPSPGTSSGAGGSGGSSSTPTAPGSTASGGTSGAAPAPLPPPVNRPPQGGLLTAGTWDDNLNFDFFSRYHSRMTATQTPGFPTFTISDRMVINVRGQGGAAVAGAAVQVSVGQKLLLTTKTGADGRVVFFPLWVGAEPGAPLTISVTSAGGAATVDAKAGSPSVEVSVAGAGAPVRGLDIALVVDTTGSMGDEIRYLQAELQTLAKGIKEAFPLVDQRWAVVAYKDLADIYVTKPVDFVVSVDAFSQSLATLSAGGGGDYPEAPDRALADMNKLSWRDGAVARMAFWLADAPAHDKDAQALAATFKGAQEKGIHIYPIAASGADEKTEFSMRLGAMVTGGRYLFLTDDSGIGGSHKEPTIPCYFVTTMQKAMLRMVLTELSGERVEPVSADVIRTGGNPTNGRCTLADGQFLSVF